MFLASDAGTAVLAGSWGWFAVLVTLWVFNTVLGEELLFRGYLLPRMAGSFGRADWLANGVLFAGYHVHMWWGMPGFLLDALTLAPAVPVLPQRADRHRRAQRAERLHLRPRPARRPGGLTRTRAVPGTPTSSPPIDLSRRYVMSANPAPATPAPAWPAAHAWPAPPPWPAPPRRPSRAGRVVALVLGALLLLPGLGVLTGGGILLWATRCTGPTASWSRRTMPSAPTATPW